MAKLPLRYVYRNGVRVSCIRTIGNLPNGDPINVKNSYKKLLSYFTDGQVSPEELRKMAKEKLNNFLRQVKSYVFTLRSHLRTKHFCYQYNDKTRHLRHDSDKWRKNFFKHNPRLSSNSVGTCFCSLNLTGFREMSLHIWRLGKVTVLSTSHFLSVGYQISQQSLADGCPFNWSRLGKWGLWSNE